MTKNALYAALFLSTATATDRGLRKKKKPLIFGMPFLDTFVPVNPIAGIEAVPGLVAIADDDVFDLEDGSTIGHITGDCTRVRVESQWHCEATFEFFPDTISVMGVFSLNRNGTFAVVGGTGKYNAAGGRMDYYNGAEYSIVEIFLK